MEIATIGVEERGEAADECCADLVGAESERAAETDRWDASRVDGRCAA